MGYKGSTSFSSTNGTGAVIYISEDKHKWHNVGTVQNTFSTSIVKCTVNNLKGCYVKFQHNTYLGIGYLLVE